MLAYVEADGKLGLAFQTSDGSTKVVYFAGDLDHLKPDGAHDVEEAADRFLRVGERERRLFRASPIADRRTTGRLIERMTSLIHKTAGLAVHVASLVRTPRT